MIKTIVPQIITIFQHLLITFVIVQTYCNDIQSETKAGCQIHDIKNNVIFTLPHTNFIDKDVVIGQGTKIDAGVQLYGYTRIGKNCHIQAFSCLTNAIIEDNVIIRPYCVIDNSTIKNHASIGPFAHIRLNTVIGEYARIGNFVEVKQSTIGKHSTAQHLSYIGDTTMGEHVNIGAGTITCNYDGINKNKTHIQDNAFIGSNSTLVAPLTIEQGAYTAAGSVITKDVPAFALAIGRTRQVIKLGYAQKILEQAKERMNTLIKPNSNNTKNNQDPQA